MITKQDIKRCTFKKPLRTADDLLNKIRAHKNKMLLLADEWRMVTRYTKSVGFNKTKIEKDSRGMVTVTVTITKCRELPIHDRIVRFYFPNGMTEEELMNAIEEKIESMIQTYENGAKRYDEAYDKIGVLLMSIQPELKAVKEKLEDAKCDIGLDYPEMAVNELIRNYLQING